MAVAQSMYTGGIRPRSIAGIWFRHALVLRHTWLPSMAWYFVEPFVVLVAIAIGIGRLVENVDGIPYALFVTPGVIAGSAMFHAIFECSWGAFFRIQKGVFETTLTAPVSTRELALGEISWAVTRAIITATCVGVVAATLGWIESAYGAGVLFAAALVGVQFGALGLIFAALAPNIHILSLTFTVVASPLYFFSGGLLSNIRVAGLGGADSLGRATHARRTPGARILDRQPGNVTPAIGPLPDGPERRANSHRRHAPSPPPGQVIRNCAGLEPGRIARPSGPAGERLTEAGSGYTFRELRSGSLDI